MNTSMRLGIYLLMVILVTGCQTKAPPETIVIIEGNAIKENDKLYFYSTIDNNTDKNINGFNIYLRFYDRGAYYPLYEVKMHGTDQVKANSKEKFEIIIDSDVIKDKFSSNEPRITFWTKGNLGGSPFIVEELLNQDIRLLN